MPALSRRGGGSTVNAVGHGALAAQSTAALLRSQGLVGSAEGADGSGKGDADTEAQAEARQQNRREKGKGSGRLSASASALVAGVPSFRAPRAKSSLVVPPLPTTGGVVTQALLTTKPAPEASSPLAAPHSPLADASPSDAQRANPHRASSAMSFVGASPRASDFVPPSQASDTDAVSVVLPSRSDGCCGGSSDMSGDLLAEAAVCPQPFVSAAAAEVPFVLSASSLSPQRRVAEPPVSGHSEEHRVDVNAVAAAAVTGDGVNPPSAIVGGKRTRDGDAVAPEVVPATIMGVNGGAMSAQPTRGPSPAPAPDAPIAATTTVLVGRRTNVGAPLRTPLNFSSLSRQSAPSRSPPQPLISVMATGSGDAAANSMTALPANGSSTATETVNKGVAVASGVAAFAAPPKRTLLSFGGGSGGAASAGPSATVSPRGRGSGGANSHSHLVAVAPASAEVSASSVPIQSPNVTVPAIISEDGDAQREQQNPKRTLLLFPASRSSAPTHPPPPVAIDAPQPQPSVGPPPSRTRIAVAPNPQPFDAASPNPQLIAASNTFGVVASAPPTGASVHVTTAAAAAHHINASAPAVALPAPYHSATAHNDGGNASNADAIDYSRIDMSDLIVPAEHASEDGEAALLAGAKGGHFSAEAPTDDDVNAFLFAMGGMPPPAVTCMRQQQQPSLASPPTAPVPSSHVASVVGASASGGPADDAAAGSRRTLLFSAPPSAAAPSSGGIVAPALLSVASEAGPSRATAVPISVAISSSKGSPFRTRPKATPLSFGPASAAVPSAVVVEPSVNGANVSPTSATGVPAAPNAAPIAAADASAESQSNAAAPKRTALSFPKPLPVAAPTVPPSVPTAAAAAAAPVPGRSVINLPPLPPPAAPKQQVCAASATSLGSAPPNPLADTLPPAPSPWEASLSDAFSKAAGGGRRASVAVVVAPTSVVVNAVAPQVPPPAVSTHVTAAPITSPTTASAPLVAQLPPPPPPSTPFVIINKPATARPTFQTRPSPSPAASHLLMTAAGPPPPPLTSPTTAVPIGGASTAAGAGSALLSPAAANPMVSANPPLPIGNLSGAPSALVAMAPTPRGPSVSVAASPFMVVPPSMHASQQRPLTPAPPTAAGPSPDGASAVAASSHNTGLNGAASPHPPSVPIPQPQPPQQQGFYGLPEAARHLYAARGVTKGYAWQEEVLARPDVCAGDNFVYSLPTSGGKTFVAEVVLMRAILRAMGMGLGSGNNKGSVAQAAANGGAGSSCLFVLPFVSLAEEKCKALQPFADALHFNVEGYYGVQGRFPAPSAPTIFVCTIEKANSLYNHLVEEGRHSRLRCVVVDELHMVGETRRGPILELLLTKIRLASPRAQIVGMSATVPNLHQIAEWLGAGCYVGTFRPVPLKEHVVVNGIVTERCSEDPTQMVRPRGLPSADKSPLDDHMHIMHLLTEVPNCSTLVFCATRDQCLQYARQIVKTYDRMNIGPRPEGVGPLLADLRGLGHEARNLSELLPYGVAYHTGALSLEERDVVERGFKGRQITVLCCTSTLAAGVNLPARRVIFKTPYVAREFLQKSMYTQMCGRAGRAGFDVFGESFLVLSRRDAAQGMRLVMESLPPVHSGLFAERHGLARALMESLNVGVFATAANAKVWTRALMANFTHQPIPDRLLTDAAAIVKASPLFKNAPDVSGVEVGDSNGGQKEVAPRKGKGGEGRPKKKKSRTEKDKEQQANKEKNTAVAAAATLIESSASSLTLSRKGSDLTCHPPAAAAGTAAAVAATPRRRKESSNNGGAVGANTDAVCVDPHSPSPRSSKRPRGGGDGADANVGGAPPPTERFHTLSSLSQRRSRSAVGGATPSSMPRRRRAAAAVEVSDESSEEEEDEEEDEEDPIDLLIEGSIVTLVNCGLLTVEQLSPSATAVGSPSSGGAQSPTGALALLPSSATTPATTPAQRQPAAAVGGAGGGGGVLAMYGMLGLVGPSAGGGGGQGMQLDSDCPWGAAPTPPAGGAFGGLALGGTALGALLGANAGTNNGAGAPPTKPPPPSASSSLSAPIDISQPQHIPSQQYRLVLTPFGSASVRACFGIEEALLVRDEMETLQQSGVILTDDLQICYLVTPVMDPIECNWALFGKQMSSISDVRSRIAASVGLDVAFVHQRSVGLNFAHTAPPPAAATANASASSALAAVAGKHPSFHTAAAAAAAGGPPIIGGINGVSIDQHGRRSAADPQQRKLYVCRRYYAALILSDILNEVPSSTIEARYGLSYTQQQALLRSSSIFSSSMVAFCSTMSWFNVEALLAAFVKRLGFGVKPDIIPLMEISGVKASKARVLFAAGFRTPALIAASTPQELFRRVKESSPKDNKAAKFFTLKSAVVAIREANIVIQRQLREKKGELEEMALRAKMT